MVVWYSTRAKKEIFFDNFLVQQAKAKLEKSADSGTCIASDTYLSQLLLSPSADHHQQQLDTAPAAATSAVVGSSSKTGSDMVTTTTTNRTAPANNARSDVDL